MRAALALMMLSACVTPSTPERPADCNCVELPDDAKSVAETGFPNGLLYVHGSDSARHDNGLTYLAVQFDAAKATPDMIKASPAAQCRAAGMTLVSSKVVPPGPDDLKIEGSMIVRAICK